MRILEYNVLVVSELRADLRVVLQLLLELLQIRLYAVE